MQREREWGSKSKRKMRKIGWNCCSKTHHPFYMMTSGYWKQRIREHQLGYASIIWNDSINISGKNPLYYTCTVETSQSLWAPAPQKIMCNAFTMPMFGLIDICLVGTFSVVQNHQWTVVTANQHQTNGQWSLPNKMHKPIANTHLQKKKTANSLNYNRRMKTERMLK